MEEVVTELSTVATTTAPGHRSPTPELYAAYTTLEILVALVAIIGNAMVIHVFRRDRRLRRRTNYYIVSLAVADLLVGLLGIPFAILASVGLPRNLHACLFTVSLLVMLCTISIFCLVAVSVDRYWAILHPMCYSRNVRTKTAINCKGGGRRGGGQGDDEFFNDMSKLFEALFNGRPRSSSGSRTSASSRHSAHGSGDYDSYRPPSGYSGSSRYYPGRLYPYYPGSLGFPSFPNSHLIHEILHNPRAPTLNAKLQYEYAKQYSSSTSRYNDLLTGLTMYNVNRSRSIRQHNYRDSFYTKNSRNISSSTNTSQSSSSSTLIDDNSGKDEAICLMKIKENQNEEALKIPCAIVTTFGEGKRRIPDAIIDATATECVKLSMGNSTSINAMKRNYYLQKNESVDISLPGLQQLCKSIIKTIDPLSVTGPPLNTDDMECKVEIWKENEVISNIVNCESLIQYAKMSMLGNGNIRSERPIPHRAFVPLKEVMEDTDAIFSSVFDLTRSTRRQISPTPQDGDVHMSSLRPELKQTVKNHGLPSSFMEDQHRFEEFMLNMDQAFSSRAFPSLTELMAPSEELRAYFQDQAERSKQRDADTISHRHRSPPHAPSLSSIMDEKREMNDFWTDLSDRLAMLQKNPLVSPREIKASFDELYANYGDEKPEQKVLLPASRNMGDIKTTPRPAQDFVPNNWNPQSYLGSQPENQFSGLQTDE